VQQVNDSIRLVNEKMLRVNVQVELGHVSEKVELNLDIDFNFFSQKSASFSNVLGHRALSFGLTRRCYMFSESSGPDACGPMFLSAKI
jgi:hypothetical protein